MIDYSVFLSFLKTTGASIFAEQIEPLVNAQINSINHGDFDTWQGELKALPSLAMSEYNLNASTIQIGKKTDCDDVIRERLKEQLMTFHPWRKGPFDIFGIQIDTEWRSDMKWDRLKSKIQPLQNKLVLDIGCGNGYFCFRMAGQHAKAVVGIEPFLLYIMQFHVLNRYIQAPATSVLPLKVEQLPKGCACFDTVFSMGVLYHQRNPLSHLKSVYSFLNNGGELVLETLILNQDTHKLLVPEKRYAKMRNVWNIPSKPLLEQWVTEAGFTNIQIVDISKTTSEEQKKTHWMQFESLSDFLDPSDNEKTIEGYPAPVRAVLLASKP